MARPDSRGRAVGYYFRVTKTNPAAKNGQTVIAAVGINEADPYQHGEGGELKFVRGKQFGWPQ